MQFNVDTEGIDVDYRNGRWESFYNEHRASQRVPGSNSAWDIWYNKVESYEITRCYGAMHLPSYYSYDLDSMIRYYNSSGLGAGQLHRDASNKSRRVIVEAEHMPQWLSARPDLVQKRAPGWLECNYHPPKDYDQWTKFIYAYLTETLKWLDGSRLEEILVKVWNEPESQWRGSIQELLKLYDYTVKAVEQVKKENPDRKILVGGFGSVNWRNAHEYYLLQHCAANGTTLDFIDWHHWLTRNYKDELRTAVKTFDHYGGKDKEYLLSEWNLLGSKAYRDHVNTPGWFAEAKADIMTARPDGRLSHTLAAFRDWQWDLTEDDNSGWGLIRHQGDNNIVKEKDRFWVTMAIDDIAKFAKKLRVQYDHNRKGFVYGTTGRWSRVCAWQNPDAGASHFLTSSGVESMEVILPGKKVKQVIGHQISKKSQILLPMKTKYSNDRIGTEAVDPWAFVVLDIET